MIGGKWFASTSTLSSPYPIGNVHRWNKKEKREELCTPIFIFHFFSFSFSFFLFFFHSLSKPSIHLKIFFILNRARRLLRSPTQWKMWRSWWTCRFLWYLPTQRQNPLTSSQRPSRTSSRGPWASSTSSLPSLLVWTRWRQAHSWARSSSLFLLSLFRSFRLLFEWVTPRSKLNLRVLLVLHGSSCLHYCGVNSWLLLAFIGETKEIVLADILPVRWLFHHSLGAIKERRARAHCSWGNQVHSHWPAHFRLSQGFVTIFFYLFSISNTFLSIIEAHNLFSTISRSGQGQASWTSLFLTDLWGRLWHAGSDCGELIWFQDLGHWTPAPGYRLLWQPHCDANRDLFDFGDAKKEGEEVDPLLIWRLHLSPLGPTHQEDRRHQDPDLWHQGNQTWASHSRVSGSPRAWIPCGPLLLNRVWREPFDVGLDCRISLRLLWLGHRPHVSGVQQSLQVQGWRQAETHNHLPIGGLCAFLIYSFFILCRN